MALLAAFVVVLCAAPGVASGARTYLSCGIPPVISFGEEFDGQISYRQHPRRCAWSEDGSTAALINLVDLRWKQWGSASTSAIAKRVDNHDQDNNGFQRHRVRIVLDSLKPAVGHEGTRKLYYTRLRIFDPAAGTGTERLFRPGEPAIVLPEY